MVVSSLLAKAKIQVGSNVFWMRRKLCITPVFSNASVMKGEEFANREAGSSEK